MKSKQTQQRKQEQFLNKVKIIDQHIAKTADTHELDNNFQYILKLLATSFLPEPPQQLLPFVPQVVLFEEKRVKRFIVKQTKAEQGKQFIFSVISHIPVKVSIAVNDTRPKMYTIQGNKSIPILQRQWNQLIITISMQNSKLFASVKILLETLTIEHKNPKKSKAIVRPNIDKELEDYLRLTKGKALEIIRSRSLSKNQSKQIKKRAMSTATLMTERIKGEMARTKSELFKFEKKKTFYIRHVERMSPERIKFHKEKQVEYEQIKRHQIGDLSKLIMITKFGLYIRNKKIKIHRQKLRAIKINFLCMDFIKIIKNKFKLKMTEKARSRMTLLHFYHHIPSIYYESSIKNARKTLLQGLIPYMEFRGLQELGLNSQEYLRSVKLIQNFMKQKSANFRQRINVIADRFCVIYHLQVPPKKKKIVVEKYLKECQENNQFHFYANKSRLLQILREEAQ